MLTETFLAAHRFLELPLIISGCTIEQTRCSSFRLMILSVQLLTTPLHNLIPLRICHFSFYITHTINF